MFKLIHGDIFMDREHVVRGTERIGILFQSRGGNIHIESVGEFENLSRQTFNEYHKDEKGRFDPSFFIVASPVFPELIDFMNRCVHEDMTERKLNNFIKKSIKENPRLGFNENIQCRTINGSPA